MAILSGAPIVPGLAVGRAVLLVRRGRALRAPVAAAHVESELRRLEGARERTREQLTAIRARLAAGPGADLARMFDAQLLMLDDPLLVGRAAAIVTGERVNAEWGIQRASDEVAELFAGIDDEYLRERGGDVADLVGRLRMNLQGTARGWHDLLAHGDGPFVVVADDPPPSVAAQLNWSVVSGLAIDAGSRTSHTAILARSLGIPTVVGLRTATSLVTPGRLVALDGATGELVIGPTDAELVALRRREAERVAAQASERVPAIRRGTTRDGVRVRLEANLDRFEDVDAARRAGAEGIGLFRSEFLLRPSTGSGRAAGSAIAGLTGPASEAAQSAAYRRVVSAMAPAAVTIRTFDIDAAQADAFSDAQPEPDVDRHRPLGVRGIRLGLARPQILHTQFRAILRAASAGTVRILLPFVTTVQEVSAAKAALDQARASLRQEGVETPLVPLGAMIEVPAAALTADLLAAEADFLALGTNDLAQYLLAADRTDEGVAGLVEPVQPALLRVLRWLPRLSRQHKCPLSVCGEMASDPVVLGLLVGFGVREVSMTPSALPAAWHMLEGADTRELARAARQALKDATLEPVEQYLRGLETATRQ
jgi:phosphoenolpyruvate-protein phosphotransferase (PTS system enzyme I)